MSVTRRYGGALVLAALLAGCATTPPPPPAPVKPPPKEVRTADYQSAASLEASWRYNGWQPVLNQRETQDADGNRTLSLDSLVLGLSDPLGNYQGAIEAMAALAARGEKPMKLVISVRSRSQQQLISGWIKQAALASGGRNSVVLDNRIGPNNPLQLTVQYQR
ncbi:hypothetical protein [Chitinimonas lacunae]|uniref:DotD/TraH family lipoprotein n=1 Tax=Chitinimonas lacunae TaxID=1963018 RepID=A0ABV8MUM3_9NEIS